MSAVSKEPTVPIPIRLDARTRERLKRAATRLGSNRSAVIRFAVLNQLPLIEAGRIILSSEEEPPQA